MNIVIINPPDQNTIVEFPDESGDSFLEADDYGYFPPLGALYVLSYLEKNTTGHNLHFIDCVAEQINHEQLIERLQIIKPDILGMTSFTISLVDIKMVAENVKRNFPNCHVGDKKRVDLHKVHLNNPQNMFLFRNNNMRIHYQYLSNLHQLKHHLGILSRIWFH